MGRAPQAPRAPEAGARLTWLALAAAVGAAALVLLVALPEGLGTEAYLLAWFPAFLAAVPVAGDRLWPGRRALRVVAASALWLFVGLGLASIGLYYAPSAVLMTVAAFSGGRRRDGRIEGA